MLLSGTVGVRATFRVMIDFFYQQKTVQDSDHCFFFDGSYIDPSEILEDALHSGGKRYGKTEIRVDVRHRQDKIVLMLSGSNQVSLCLDVMKFCCKIWCIC